MRWRDPESKDISEDSGPGLILMMRTDIRLSLKLQVERPGNNVTTLSFILRVQTNGASLSKHSDLCSVNESLSRTPSQKIEVSKKEERYESCYESCSTDVY